LDYSVNDLVGHLKHGNIEVLSLFISITYKNCKQPLRAPTVGENAEELITNPEAFDKAEARANGILDASSLKKLLR
jgi:hypothetical protein